MKCVCGSKFYCNKECQKLDWKTHKSGCPPFVLKPVAEKGRGLFATRNIPRGTNVLEEFPILTLKEDGKIKDEFQKLPRAKQDKVLNLHDPGNDDDPVSKRLDRIMDDNNNFVHVSIESIQPETQLPATHDMRLIYLNVCLVNHSCNPNCFRSKVDLKTFRETLTTLIDVKKGEELTCNYMVGKEVSNPENIGLTYEERQLKISRLFWFKCSCEECLNGKKNDALRKEYQKLSLDFDKSKSDGYQDQEMTSLTGCFNFAMKYFAIAEKKLNIGKQIQRESYLKDLLECIEQLCILCEFDRAEDLGAELRQSNIFLDPSAHVKFMKYKMEAEAMLKFLPEWREAYYEMIDTGKDIRG